MTTQTKDGLLPQDETGGASEEMSVFLNGKRTVGRLARTVGIPPPAGSGHNDGVVWHLPAFAPTQLDPTGFGDHGWQ
jgi:hypothetical protein